MSTQHLDDAIKVEMAVQTSEGSKLGVVTDVWTNVGVGESWGAVGTSTPERGADATDTAPYAFSEAMPGEGDNYFRARQPDGRELYIPFSAVGGVEDNAVVLAVDEDTVPGMQWDIMPDFINISSAADSQGGSHVA
ncbi:MAG: hypothetical protein ACKVVP_19365 [Chloroflexota bacterium]